MESRLQRLSCKTQKVRNTKDATASEIAAPKPDGSRRQSRKKTILKHFLKGFLQGKLLAPKLRKSADKSISQPGCSHSNTIYDLQLQKRIVLRMQPRQQATLTQPFQCDLQARIQETHRTTHTGTTTCCKTQRRNQTTPAATAAHTRYLSSPAAATLHGKTQGFVPRLPPHNTEHFPSSPLPILTTSLRHHFPSSPLPFVTTSLGHHCPSSPPCVIASYCFVMYCCVMLSLRPPCVIASYSFVMYCYVMSSLKPPCVIAYYSFVMYCYAMQKTHTTLHQCQISQFYLSITRKYCFPTSFDNSIKNTRHPIHRNQIEINLSKKIYHWLGLRDSSRQGKMKETARQAQLIIFDRF